MTDEGTCPPLKVDPQQRKALYEREFQGLRERQMSNSETYDRSILSLSSALLAVSMMFISNIVTLDEAIWRPVLYSAWFCFAGAIVVTIGSFIYGQRKIRRQFVLAKKFYFEHSEEAFDENERIVRATDCWNVASGIVFALGVVLLIAFATVNAGGTMSRETADSNGGVVKRGQPASSFERPDRGASDTPEAPPQGRPPRPGHYGG